MWSVLIPASAESQDLLSADLWEVGTAGLLEEASGLRAFFPDSIERPAVCARFNVAEVACREEPFAPGRPPQVACDPVLIGQRFFVAPSWVTIPTPAERFRLTIDATSAFGSGRHESTQLCIEVLEKHLKAASTVLDIGCGSGILTAAATLLGAKTVIACDIHEDSAKAAKTLVDAPLFAGSADSIRAHSADLVLANISRRVLDAIAADLRRIIKPDGLIVIAGFLRDNPPKKFRSHEIWEKCDWQCWLCGPEDIEASQEASEPPPHIQEWWL